MLVEIKIDDGLYVRGLPPAIASYFRDRCLFRLENNGEIEEVDLYREAGSTPVLPRGYIYELVQILTHGNIPYSFISQEGKYLDCNHVINPEINYTSGPFAYQGTYINQLINNYKIGRLQAPTGAGKTILSSIIIGLLNKGPVLFLANKDVLLRQFTREVSKVLQIPKEEIGLIKQKSLNIKPVTAGSLQTIGKSTFDIDQIRNKFYTVFFDEVHYGSALQARNAILNLGAERLYGLSATPEHYKDETKNEIMTALFGPVVVQVPESVIPKRLTPVILVRKTDLNFYYDFDRAFPQWKKFKLKHGLEEQIATNKERNILIVKDCYNLVVNLGHKVIICVNRVEHGETLVKALKKIDIRVSFPYKKDKKDKFQVDHKKLDSDVENMKDNLIDVIVGTYKLIDTGFNVPQLSAIQLAGPVNGENSTALIQSTGRILRYLPNKETAIVLDYADESGPHPLLKTWAEKRADFFKSKYHNLKYLD